MRYTPFLLICIYVILICFVLAILIPLIFSINLNDLFETIIYIVIAFLVLDIIISQLIPFTKLPGCSLYHPFGHIELHIGNTHKGNHITFYRLCARTVLAGIKKNKKVNI